MHWGLYAIPAWHEQIQWRKGIPRSEYAKLMEKFNPLKFEPERWLDIAGEAGMEYICFTVKHHDGFCMWDTEHTSFKSTNSPYGKDILSMLAEACHRRKFPLCLYYSIADWNHPNYPNQGKSHELAKPEKGDRPDLEEYLDFLKAQIREICTKYGEIHGLWWDMNQTGQRLPGINTMIRNLQPKAVINDRGFDEGDFKTPEREWTSDPAKDMFAFSSPVEAVNSVGTQSWGYKSDEDYYSLIHLIRSIDSTIARGGNYMLNVGPKANGEIPAPALKILGSVGKWYKSVKESFSGEYAPGLIENPDVIATEKERDVFIHLRSEPKSSAVILKPVCKKPRRAVLLNTGADVECRTDLLPSCWQTGKKYLRLRNLPVNKFSNQVLVIKLTF